MQDFYLICACILAAITGLCVGSFLNVLIWRLPRGENIVKPASHCPLCGAPLKWYDNIPVISYIVLRGKCRNCGKRIPPRYIAVETINCLLWLACVLRFYTFGLAAAAVLCIALSALTAAFFTDLESMMIPDSVTAALALCGLTALALEVFGLGTGVSWQDRLSGFVLGAGLFAAFYFGSKLFIKREGLGFGDVKLMGAAGLLLGWKSTLLCITVASVSAVIWMFFFPAARRRDAGKNGEGAGKNGEFPFAPFLTASAAFCLFFGDAIVSSYIRLFLGG